MCFSTQYGDDSWLRMPMIRSQLVWNTLERNGIESGNKATEVSRE